MPIADAGNWWLFAGKLHPVVVHFPIALLMVGAGLEVVRIRREYRWKPGAAAVVCLALGAPAAVLAAALGWSDAVTSGHGGSDAWVLDWHRWLGVATAGAAVAAGLAAVAAGSMQGRRSFAWYRFVLILSAVLVGVTGHFGGSLIYGTQYFPDSWAKARGATVGAVALAAPVDFTHDVQPILARRCYQCHAGDKVEGDLHLDSREGGIKGGKSGRAAIVPGSPGASELVRLIKGADPRRTMPPKNGALEPQQIAVLEAWIAQGAKWRDAAAGEAWHWAYRTPVRANPPAVKDAYWARNPIDQFVLAKLESEGLKPSPQADKATLIRRVSLDLIGLPPTPAEIGEFLADPSAQAYERLVYRLLASPHYGERMAMKWLDLARYADTHGYEKDQRRTMWPYRDWVIEAFNRDEPYDQFTIEQLAGDLLPEPSTDQLVATGFNRNTQINEEGGVDPEEFRIDAVIDRTNTVGTVWLGTTVGCAQCHDHKNDPIRQEEYYRFLAYFNADVPDVETFAPSEVRAAGGMLPVAAKDHRDEFAGLKREVSELKAGLAHYPEAELAAGQRAWEDELSRKQPAWTTLSATRATSDAGATLTRQDDGSYLASGKDEERDTYTFEAPAELAGVTGIRLEVFPDDSMPGKGVGRSSHSNIVLSDFRVSVSPMAGAEYAEVAIPQAAADHEQGMEFGGGGVWPIAGAIDADPKTGWALGPKTKEAHTAVFRLRSALGGGVGSSGTGAMLRIVMAQNFGGHHTIGRLRLSVTNDPDPLTGTPLSPVIAEILRTPAAARTEPQRETLAAYYRGIAPALAPMRDRLAAASKRYDELTVAQAMIMKRDETARQTHVFERGSFMAPGKPVEPGVPAAIYRPVAGRSQPRNRLELARWMVGDDNPLTARVEVNRLWEQHFGRGFVETSEDFGTQGDYPTHPELLDWLATEFVRQGWSMKAMHRLIVTSAAYRQASGVSKDLLERDPYNKLLTRGPRVRVEAETVRDVALSAAGLLSEKIGGPSVFPPQPGGVWTMIYSSDKWAESAGEDRYRRGLYTFSRRTAPYPAFTAFDSTSREVMCTRRARTNTPLQALTTLNDPQYVEAAVGVAARMLREGGATDAGRVERGFLLCVGRPPSEMETSRLVALVKDERGLYRSDPGAARKLLASAPGVERVGLDEPELAAWSVAGNVMLNLDETITRE